MSVFLLSDHVLLIIFNLEQVIIARQVAWYWT